MITQEIEKHIRCLNCKADKPYIINHLPVGYKISWYCDRCNTHFKLHISSVDEVEFQVTQGDSTVHKVIPFISTSGVVLPYESWLDGVA